MKNFNKYLTFAIIILLFISFAFFYYMNKKNESFTHSEEQIITAQLLAANGGFIPKIAGNQSEESQYKYINSIGMNVNNMPLNVQRLTNPLCFNDVLHSQPYTSSNKKGGLNSGNGSKLKHDKFVKTETPAMKQLIKANDQLIDVNEELLILAGKGEHEKKHQAKNKKKNDKLKRETEKNNDSTTGNVSPLSLTISVNTPGAQSVPINIQSSAGAGGAGTSVSPLTPVATKTTTTQRSTTPTYSSIYEEQITGSPYTKCVNRGYSSDYCNNVYDA
jgi:hypothetical protein